VKVFEYKGPRRTFGSDEEEVTGGRRTLHYYLSVSLQPLWTSAAFSVS
jgi:hypothetical protein